MEQLQRRSLHSMRRSSPWQSQTGVGAPRGPRSWALELPNEQHCLLFPGGGGRVHLWVGHSMRPRKAVICFAKCPLSLTALASPSGTTKHHEEANPPTPWASPEACPHPTTYLQVHLRLIHGTDFHLDKCPFSLTNLNTDFLRQSP